MGEETIDSSIFDGTTKIVCFDYVSGESIELGTVVNGVSVDTTTDPIEIRNKAEQGESVSHLLPSNNLSFSCTIKDPELLEEFYRINAEQQRILEIAEGLRKDIGELIRAFGRLKEQGKLNRRERREREREIAKKHKHFVLYCKAHNIQFSRK